MYHYTTHTKKKQQRKNTILYIHNDRVNSEKKSKANIKRTYKELRKRRYFDRTIASSGNHMLAVMK